MSDLALVVIVSAGSALMRLSMITLLADVAIPPRLEQALRLVAPAVLAGLVAQTLFIQGGDLRPFSTWYVAAAIALVVAWRTRSVGWTLLIGMVSVWILEAAT